jgi:hypothetical protein
VLYSALSYHFSWFGWWLINTTLMIETACFPEMLASTNQSVQQLNPKEHNQNDKMKPNEAADFIINKPGMDKSD